MKIKIDHKSVCQKNKTCTKCGRIGCNGCIYEESQLCIICAGTRLESMFILYPPKGDWDT